MSILDLFRLNLTLQFKNIECEFKRRYDRIVTKTAENLDTVTLEADESGIAAASDLLRNGGLVAFPTETVYGLGADATNDQATAKVFAAKDRPTFNPLIVHVHNLEQVQKFGCIKGRALALADAFWPGPLTIVAKRTADCPASLLVSAGLDTIALRVPAHPVAQALLSSSGLAIAAPSANRSGNVSPTSGDHVRSELAGRIDAILDGGPCKVGLESTIVGFDGEASTILRPGGIDRAMIDAIAGPLGEPNTSSNTPTSPGQLESHYAPRTRLRLNATSVEGGEALLAFGSEELKGAVKTLNLSPSGDLVEAAAKLFSHMRALDDAEALSIAVMPVPDRGLGEGINDRLNRAAAPR